MTIYDLLVRIFADGGVVAVILIGGLVLLFKIPKGKRFEAYTRILMAGLTTYLIAKFVASIYQPSFERPFELLGAAPGALYLNNPGFPSDHALFATAITAAVWFETRMKKTTLVLVVLTVLMCVGRVLALVHTPLDVAGGIVIGLVGAVWYVHKTPVGEKEVSHGTDNHHRSASSR
ncbi:MAG: Phosphoesterase, PA-phosphatase related protein [Candidatus Saccharibacteria bacterium]|nr:Phosphoesterase, PA-phosphatase related protein [Candidatus Saccharibacteria bacterium]